MISTTILSSKFQITIPVEARRILGLQAGRHLDVRVVADRIELVPHEPVSTLLGMFEGASAEVQREKDRV